MPPGLMAMMTSVNTEHAIMTSRTTKSRLGRYEDALSPKPSATQTAAKRHRKASRAGSAPFSSTEI